MKNLIKILALTVFISINVNCTLSNAQETGVTLEEELRWLRAETVVITASKYEQKIGESPVSVTVITAEDIKQSGAVDFVEALRIIPGINVAYVAHGLMLTNIRGFSKIPSNKVVLLVDGRLCSWEAYGTPWVIAPPIALEEIERIEVLRGPGSSLYGANAMFGVINIITKKTSDTEGSLVSFTGGEKGAFLGTYMHGNPIRERLNYRLTLSWDQKDNWGPLPFSSDPFQKKLKVNTTIDYSFDENSQLSFLGSYAYLKDFYALFSSTGPINLGNSDIYDIAVTYTSKSPNLIARVFWNYKDLWERGHYLGVSRIPARTGTKSIEFQHVLEPLASHKLVYGANFTKLMTEGDVSILIGKYESDLWGLFLEDSYRVRGNFNLNLGLRFDRHSLFEDTFSHRLAALYFPYPNHHIRVSWGSSFRNPDFIETYMFNDYRPAQPMVLYGGGDQLKPEKAETYELGYQTKLTRKLDLEMNLFYSKVKDIVNFVPTALVAGPALRLDFLNTGKFSQRGLEVELRHQFADWVSGLLNYTYLSQHIEKLWYINPFYIRLGVPTAQQTAEEFLNGTPKHMANAQLQAKFENGLSTNLALHYVSDTQWRKYAWGNGGKVDAYTIVNARVGYTFPLTGNDAEISLAAFNLFNKKHQEYPSSPDAPVGRRITGTFACKF